LSTKALSTMLSDEWVGIFKEWITYPIIMVLVGTGIGQIRYLNRALMKFDSKQVIPTQFVLFNLSAIVGSAILYGDFYKVQLHQFITFLYGCGATFAGVYLLTRANSSDDEDRSSRSGGDVERSGGGRLPDIPEENPARNMPVLKSTGSGPIRILTRKQSTTGIGLSPGQYLLLAAPSTPTDRRARSPDNDRRNSFPTSRARSAERPSSLFSQR